MGNVRRSDTRCASKRRVLGVAGSGSLGAPRTHGGRGSRTISSAAAPSVAGGQFCPLCCACIPPSARCARPRQAREKGKLLFYNNSSPFGGHRPCLSEPIRANSSQFWPDRCLFGPFRARDVQFQPHFLRRAPEKGLATSGRPKAHAGKFVRRTFLSVDMACDHGAADKRMRCRLRTGGGVVLRDSPWSRAVQQVIFIVTQYLSACQPNLHGRADSSPRSRAILSAALRLRTRASGRRKQRSRSNQALPPTGP